jgi:hypothetical protein
MIAIESAGTVSVKTTRANTATCWHWVDHHKNSCFMGPLIAEAAALVNASMLRDISLKFLLLPMYCQVLFHFAAKLYVLQLLQPIYGPAVVLLGTHCKTPRASA